MSLEQSSGYCHQCQSNTLTARPSPNHVLHAIVTLFMCGMWIPVWIFITLFPFDPYRCQTCGAPVKSTKGPNPIALGAAIIFTLFVALLMLIFVPAFFRAKVRAQENQRTEQVNQQTPQPKRADKTAYPPLEAQLSVMPAPTATPVPTPTATPMPFGIDFRKEPVRFCETAIAHYQKEETNADRRGDYLAADAAYKQKQWYKRALEAAKAGTWPPPEKTLTEPEMAMQFMAEFVQTGIVKGTYLEKRHIIISDDQWNNLSIPQKSRLAELGAYYLKQQAGNDLMVSHICSSAYDVASYTKETGVKLYTQNDCVESMQKYAFDAQHLRRLQLEWKPLFEYYQKAGVITDWDANANTFVDRAKWTSLPLHQKQQLAQAAANMYGMAKNVSHPFVTIKADVETEDELARYTVESGFKLLP